MKFTTKTWCPALISALAGVGVLGATLAVTCPELPWTIYAAAALGSLATSARHILAHRRGPKADAMNGAGCPAAGSGLCAAMVIRVPVAISLGVLAANRYWTPDAMAIEAVLLHLLAFAEAARPPNMTRVLLALFRQP